LPEGAEPTISDRDFTVATIVGRGSEEETETEDEGAEEEVAEEETPEEETE
jgi:large subunit ribosomal protein L25